MNSPAPTVAHDWKQFERTTPDWFARSPLGIFVHWGAYSVPAWAEPIGALGTIDEATWFAHNPYAEWYSNTIMIDGSPAQEHHRRVHGGADYDAFLDGWHAEHFDPAAWAELFAEAGADYVIPTTKHHDGIALWDAPGTDGRNTVRRGPRRDLVGEIADAVRGRGMRLGLYYSGGLDWHYRPFPPHRRHITDEDRPNDAGYAAYAFEHVRDLVDRYQPSILWNDIEWPDAGKDFGDHGLGTLFRHFYASVPDGLVNDRWGASTHHDYATSEYEHMRGNEDAVQWENCRGIGYSFGYNQTEGPEHYLTGHKIARHLVDVVSRGGHLLLNVGPRADGTIPEIQERALRDLGAWMAIAKTHLVGAVPLVSAPSAHDASTWVRWVAHPDRLVAFVDAEPGSAVVVDVPADAAAVGAELVGSSGRVDLADGKLKVSTDAQSGPAVVTVPRS